MYGKLNDKVNDSYGFIYAFTQFVAPLASSAVYDKWGMSTKFDITAIIFVCYAVVLMIFNCGPSFAAENRRFILEFTKYQT